MKFILGLLLISFQCAAAESVCYGTTSQGKLENGVQLPPEGNNYISYNTLANLLGRTYVHSKVRDIVVGAYARLESELPNKVFKYAETGYAEGGNFQPHKTHQNGLSVDFMTPVLNEKGESVHLPTHSLNKYGYSIEFDSKGKYAEYRIDYGAMAAHIVALHKQAKHEGYDLWRVIFDPELQPNLFATEYGGYLQDNIQFSRKRSWVRHDQHYHIDFSIPCR